MLDTFPRSNSKRTYHCYTGGGKIIYIFPYTDILLTYLDPRACVSIKGGDVFTRGRSDGDVFTAGRFDLGDVLTVT